MCKSTGSRSTNSDMASIKQIIEEIRGCSYNNNDRCGNKTVIYYRIDENFLNRTINTIVYFTYVVHNPYKDILFLAFCNKHKNIFLIERPELIKYKEMSKDELMCMELLHE